MHPAFVIDVLIPQPCPTCKFPLEPFLETIENPLPKSGDFSVCPWCGSIAVFADDLTQRKAGAMDELRLKLSDAWETILKVRQILGTRASSLN